MHGNNEVPANYYVLFCLRFHKNVFDFLLQVILPLNGMLSLLSVY